jgi:hypothetical protein
MADMLKGALGLAAWGVPVISLRPGTKIPIHAGWPALGMLDADTISTEWRINPGANVGALCGPEGFDGAGLAILDVDLPDGPASVERLEELHGPRPGTVTADTPSRGWHEYYRGHAPSWNPAPGLEVRSVGRQCAAPPSVVNGARYEWRHELGEPDLYRAAQLPAWLAQPPRARIGNGDRHLAITHAGGLRDPVLDVPPPVYFERLCGLTPDRQGFVCCPIHQEAEASCKVYATADRGWFCYGETCRKGGDVVTLVAELAGIPTPVRGPAFLQLLDYLAGRLL